MRVLKPTRAESFAGGAPLKAEQGTCSPPSKTLHERLGWKFLEASKISQYEHGQKEQGTELETGPTA